MTYKRLIATTWHESISYARRQPCCESYRFQLGSVSRVGRNQTRYHLLNISLQIAGETTFRLPTDLPVSSRVYPLYSTTEVHLASFYTLNDEVQLTRCRSINHQARDKKKLAEIRPPQRKPHSNGVCSEHIRKMRAYSRWVNVSRN